MRPQTNHAARAKLLLKALEKERSGTTIYLGKAMKSFPTTKAILDAGPDLQMALVQHVVETFSRLGAETQPDANYWWGDPHLPWGSAEMADKLLRRRLPFSDQDLAEMLEKLARIGLLTTAVVPCVEKLVAEVERRGGERPLAPGLLKAVGRIADGLTGRKLSRTAARLWKQEEHAPVARDRKLAARIDRLLEGPLDLTKA